MSEGTQKSAPTDPHRQAAAEEPDEPGPLVVAGRVVLENVLAPFVEIGYLTRMFGQVLYWGFRPPFRFRQFVSAMEFIGVGSIFIISLTGLFTGAVLSLQLVDGFRKFSADSQTGGVVGIALARELGPVFAGLMVSSRAGSAMTTELGSMRVSSQIDAMLTMAVNPVQYLIVPRVFAGFTMVPFLTMLFDIIGMVGAHAVGVGMMGLDPGVFQERVRALVDWPDVRQGLVKAAVFGATISLIACRHGFFATGGAAGVGLATNRCVVHCAIAILALDYLITGVMLGQGLG